MGRQFVVRGWRLAHWLAVGRWPFAVGLGPIVLVRESAVLVLRFSVGGLGVTTMKWSKRTAQGFSPAYAPEAGTAPKGRQTGI
jgi:hypothetical protein